MGERVLSYQRDHLSAWLSRQECVRVHVTLAEAAVEARSGAFAFDRDDTLAEAAVAP